MIGEDSPWFGFQWHITNRCNLKCRHCYQDEHHGRDDVGLDGLRRMADEIFGTLAGRSIAVNVTGGEPLGVPYLFELIDHLEGFTNLDEVNLIINGTKADEAIIERISDSPKIATLKVSLESADEATNDAVRGKGSFAVVAANIERFLTTGKDVVLMVTLANYNIAHIGNTIEWARSHGLSGVVLERFVPLGRGRGIMSQLPTSRDWLTAVRAIIEASGVDGEPEELAGYRAFWIGLGESEDELRGAHCNLGDEAMALMPDGTVYPCRRLVLPQGRLLETPFEEVLTRLARFRVSELRRQMPAGRCGSCALENCAGCRALALAATGDPLADDPQCFSFC